MTTDTETSFIIAGSRDITDIRHVNFAMEKLYVVYGIRPTTVISGTARGVDTLGEEWGQDHRCKIIRMPADWTTHGKSAGYKRNEHMAHNADGLVAIWDGHSRGTGHMIDTANRLKLPTLIHNPKDTP
jgi:hypothetical protein